MWTQICLIIVFQKDAWVFYNPISFCLKFFLEVIILIPHILFNEIICIFEHVTNYRSH